MYKALLTSPETEIVLLEPRWRARIAELRTMGNSGTLVCPGCREAARLRAGKLRRWHFAHHHLQNCPLSGQSPELLAARDRLQRQDQFRKSIQSRRTDTTPIPANPVETSLDSASRPVASPAVSLQPFAPPPRQAFTRSGVCLHCGKETTDWVTYIGKTSACVCRECYNMTTTLDY